MQGGEPMMNWSVGIYTNLDGSLKAQINGTWISQNPLYGNKYVYHTIKGMKDDTKETLLEAAKRWVEEYDAEVRANVPVSVEYENWSTYV